MTLPSRLSDDLALRLGAESAASLERVLDTLAGAASEILGDRLVGVYLLGSFALGHGDAASDVDFLVVSRLPPTPLDEPAIRRLHAGLPQRSDPWARHLEGSWVSDEAIGDPVGRHDPWLYVDNGSRRMEYSRHDDSATTRWVLRNAGIPLVGPPPDRLLPDVPPGVMRAEAVDQADLRVRWILDEPDALLDGWAQPYVVLTLCRALWTCTFGTVTSKGDAARWAAGEVAPARYRDLITASIRYRVSPFDPDHGRADPAYAPIAAEFVMWAADAVHERAGRPGRQEAQT